MVIASLLVTTPTEQQEPQTTTDEATETLVQYEAWQVQVIQGAYPLQFTKGKLWPQGEKQSEYAQMSYEYTLRIGHLAENKHLAKTSDYQTFFAETQKMKKQMDSMAVGFKLLDAPVEAIVREIHELNGSVYVIGAAFGSLSYAPVKDIPKSACMIDRRITEEAFPDFIMNLRRLAAIEASLIEEEDDEEEEEETEDEEETEEEETTADVVVDAATALVSSTTSIEVRPEGPVVLVPASAWEPLCQAIAAHHALDEETEGEGEEAEQDDGSAPAEPNGGAT